MTANTPAAWTPSIPAAPMTMAEAAEVLGVNPATLWRWYRAGTGPARTVAAGRVWYDAAEVLELAAERAA